MRSVFINWNIYNFIFYNYKGLGFFSIYSNLWVYINIIEERILIFKCNKLNWNFFSSSLRREGGAKEARWSERGKKTWMKKISWWNEMKQKKIHYTHTKSKKYKKKTRKILILMKINLWWFLVFWAESHCPSLFLFSHYLLFCFYISIYFFLIKWYSIGAYI